MEKWNFIQATQNISRYSSACLKTALLRYNQNFLPWNISEVPEITCSYLWTWIYRLSKRFYKAVTLSHVCRIGKKEFSLLWYWNYSRADPCLQKRKMLHQFVWHISQHFSHIQSFPNFAISFSFPDKAKPANIVTALKKHNSSHKSSQGLSKITGLIFKDAQPCVSLWPVSVLQFQAGNWKIFIVR